MQDYDIDKEFEKSQIPRDENAFHSGQGEILKTYAKKCDHITEVGVNIGASTRAFLAGRPKEMVGIDIRHYGKATEFLINLAEYNGIKYTYIQQDSLTAPLVETDLVLLDGDHSYDVVYKELERYSKYCKKYIILHDTNKDGEPGPTGYMVRTAAMDWLKQNPNWWLQLEDTRLAGLIVLRKIKDE